MGKVKCSHYVVVVTQTQALQSERTVNFRGQGTVLDLVSQMLRYFDVTMLTILVRMEKKKTIVNEDY